jgi:hypothetical protein
VIPIGYEPAAVGAFVLHLTTPDLFVFVENVTPSRVKVILFPERGDPEAFLRVAVSVIEPCGVADDGPVYVRTGTGRPAGATVSVVLPVTAPSVAEMVLCPAATAWASPLAVIVATEVVPELQVTEPVRLAVEVSE